MVKEGLKVVVDRDRLLDALKSLPFEKKGALPMLSTFKLDISEDRRLSITGTDLDVYGRVSMGVEGEGEGSFCLNARKLVNVLKGMDSGDVYIESHGESVVIKKGRSKYKFAIVDTADYPEWPKTEGQEIGKVSFTADDFIDAIESIIFAASKEGGLSQYPLEGVYVHPHEGRVRFVASDGHRLSLCEKESEGRIELLVSAKALKFVLKVFKASSSLSVEVRKYENAVSFKMDDLELLVSELEGKFPDYEKLIPTNFACEISLPVDELKGAISRLQGVGDEKAVGISIEASEGRVILRAELTEEEGEEVIEADVRGKGRVTLNSQYLIDFLSVAFYRVKMGMNSEDEAVLMTDESGRRYLVMPMRV